MSIPGSAYVRLMAHTPLPVLAGEWRHALWTPVEALAPASPVPCPPLQVLAVSWRRCWSRKLT